MDTMTITAKEFRALCERHDVYYMMSDDRRAYQAGDKSWREIQAARKALGDAVAAPIWNEVIRQKLGEHASERMFWPVPEVEASEGGADDWDDLTFEDVPAPKLTAAERQQRKENYATHKPVPAGDDTELEVCERCGAGEVELLERPCTKPVAPTQKPTAVQRAAASYSAVLIFDLETIPDESRMESFGLDPLPDPPQRTSEGLVSVAEASTWTVAKLTAYLKDKQPANDWLDMLAEVEAETDKKPRAGVFSAIEAIKKVETEYDAAVADRQKLMSVVPEYCRICAAAWAWEDQGDIQSAITDPKRLDETERKIIQSLWKMIESARTVCGFNILHFDMNVLAARSIILGVDPPKRQLDLAPWKNDICDLYAKRFPKFKGSGQPGKLKELAQLYGIEVPAGDVEGSQVAELFATDRKKLRKYVESDVEVTRQLYRKLRGFYF